MRILLVFLAITACVRPIDTVEMADRVVPQSEAEIAFVTDLFNDLQPRSIAEAREYCGLIGITSQGVLVATPPRRGRMASCLPPAPAWLTTRVIASYHTHGNADLEYFTEIPSFDDIRTDIEEGTDGYIATPGGRLWYIDARARAARQLCGKGCLISDPNHVDDPDLVVQQRYSLKQLLEF